MKKSSKSSLKKKKKRSLDISLQHKNEASYKVSKIKTFGLGQKSPGAERVKVPLDNKLTGMSSGEPHTPKNEF